MDLFLRPKNYVLPFGLIGAASALSFGLRFYAGNGELATMIAVVVLAAVTAVYAKQWPALNQLGASFKRWFVGAFAFTAISVVALTATSSTASHIMQKQSPFYSMYDQFLLTAGPVTHLDTNGDP